MHDKPEPTRKEISAIVLRALTSEPEFKIYARAGKPRDLMERIKTRRRQIRRTIKSSAQIAAEEAAAQIIAKAARRAALDQLWIDRPELLDASLPESAQHAPKHHHRAPARSKKRPTR